MLEFSYITSYGGHGKMSIDLEGLLPCSKADFRILTDTIRLSADPIGNAEKVYNFIADKVAGLQKFRGQCNPGADNTQITKCNAEIKRFLGLADMLTAEYGFTKIEDADGRITLKAATVYAFINDKGQNKIEVCGGWTFEKAGYKFDVYKMQKLYIILLHGAGLKVAESASKAGTVAAITPRLLEIIKKTMKAEGFKQQQKVYKKLMEEAGYTESNTENKKESKKDNNKNNSKTEKEAKIMKKNNNYFTGVKTLEELRIVYLELLKTNHPDNGGDVAIMQEINAQYDQVRETLKSGATIGNEKDAAKWSDVEDESIRQALYKVIHLHGINIEIVGCWIWIDGDTFANREALKEAGYKWSRTRQKWHFAPYEPKWHKGSKKSFDQLRRTYGSAKVENEERHEIA